MCRSRGNAKVKGARTSSLNLLDLICCYQRYRPYLKNTVSMHTLELIFFRLFCAPALESKLYQH